MKAVWSSGSESLHIKWGFFGFYLSWNRQVAAEDLAQFLENRLDFYRQVKGAVWSNQTLVTVQNKGIISGATLPLSAFQLNWVLNNQKTGSS